MKDLFIPYTEALALKELGFDEPCITSYDDEGLLRNPFDYANSEYDEIHNKQQYYEDAKHFVYNSELTTIGRQFVAAPTFSQCFRFFREKYNWQHSIDPTADQHSHQLGYNYWIWNYKTGEEHHTMPKNRPTGDWEYKTYEEAELACLEKLIEIVESKLKVK